MRDAEQTRQLILTVSSEEIRKNGFNATSLSTILAQCNISKGALYHHFSNKLELGYAVLEEVYTPMFLSMWEPVVTQEDPIDSLINFFSSMVNEMSCEDIMCGCPLNRLCQEMATVDEGFRLRILAMQQQLNTLISENLRRVSHLLRDELNYSQVSYFIVSAFHGSTSLSKSTQSKALFEMVMSELCRYISALKK
ncbi:TetR/AcrR family transcriptional regulator [Colwellia sp. MEBiC06753]